jgi:LysR family nitrogen assimilation transcriptional regulator
VGDLGGDPARSLASAAVFLGVAQPSLSQHVKSLEQRLGVELLLRSPRGVELTEAGQVFLLHARKILDATTIAREEVRLAGTEPIGQVAFGFPSSVSMVLSVALAETLRQERPKIRFRAVEAMNGFIRNWLEDGTVDLAILYDISNLKTAHSQFLLAEDLHYYCAADDWNFTTPPGHPLTFAQVAGRDCWSNMREFRGSASVWSWRWIRCRRFCLWFGSATPRRFWPLRRRTNTRPIGRCSARPSSSP